MSAWEDTRCPECGLAAGEHAVTCSQYVAPTPAEAAAAPTEAGPPSAPASVGTFSMSNVRQLVSDMLAPVHEAIDRLEARLNKPEPTAPDAPPQTIPPIQTSTTGYSTATAVTPTAVTPTAPEPPAEPPA